MNGRGHTTHSLVITLFVIHDFVSFHNIRRYPQRTKDHLEMTDQLDAPDLITYLTGGPSELDELLGMRLFNDSDDIWNDIQLTTIEEKSYMDISSLATPPQSPPDPPPPLLIQSSDNVNTAPPTPSIPFTNSHLIQCNDNAPPIIDSTHMDILGHLPSALPNKPHPPSTTEVLPVRVT
jgi:hypothetical protein